MKFLFNNILLWKLLLWKLIIVEWASLPVPFQLIRRARMPTPQECPPHKDAHPTRMPTPQESLFLQDAYLNKIVK